MGRSPRIYSPGDILHIGGSSVPTDVLFRNDEDRRAFLLLLAAVVEKHDWRCLTYCLMGNHYHLLVQVLDQSLSDGMRRLNGDYARAFNERHDRTSNLFDRRFWCDRIETERRLYAAIRYIALNPKNHGFTHDPSRWRWSAHNALAAGAPDRIVDVSRTLGYFGEDPAGAASQYAAFVAGTTLPVLDGADIDLVTILAHPDRNAAILRAAERGFSDKDIAAVLGCRPRAVRRRLETARRQDASRIGPGTS